MSLDTDIRPDTTPVTSHGDPGDHERFAHYAAKGDIARAIVEGVPIVALCKKRWVPHRDPKGFPVCPECKEIYEGLADDEPES